MQAVKITRPAQNRHQLNMQKPQEAESGRQI